MRNFASFFIIAASAIYSTNAVAQTFTEMPNNTGTYKADFGSVAGWKVLGLGDRSVSACFAYKGELDTRIPAKPFGLIGGNIQLINIDTAFIMQRDEAYSQKQTNNPLKLHVSGRYSVSDDTYEWRWSGDKFFTPLERGGQYGLEKLRLTLDELKPHVGKILDVKASSWEYPAVRVGLNDDSGKLSLTGLDQIQSKIEACEAALVKEFPSHYRNAAFTASPQKPIVLPSIPQGWKKTDFGNYMAFNHEWLTFLYRKTKSGSPDTYFLVDMNQFKKLDKTRSLEININDRNIYLSTSRFATNNFGEGLYPFTSLFLTSEDLDSLNSGALEVKAKFKKEKLKFTITGFKQAEEYRVKWNEANP